MMFLRTFETTQNGMLHINLVVYGISWFTDGELDHIKAIWSPVSASDNAIDYKTIRAEQNKSFANAYVCKYIFKQFKEYIKEDGSKEVMINQDTVIGWAMGWRSFAMSRDLKYQLDLESGIHAQEQQKALIRRMEAGLGLHHTTKNSKWAYCCTVVESREGLFDYHDVQHRHRDEVDDGGEAS